MRGLISIISNNLEPEVQSLPALLALYSVVNSVDEVLEPERRIEQSLRQLEKQRKGDRGSEISGQRDRATTSVARVSCIVRADPRGRPILAALLADPEAQMCWNQCARQDHRGL